MDNSLTAPPHLRAAGKAFWREIATQYQLDPHERKLLSLICEQIDLESEATRTIKKLGPTYEVKGKLLVRPEVDVQRQSSRLIGSLIRQLKIPSTESAEPQPRTRNGTFGRVRRTKAAA